LEYVRICISDNINSITIQSQQLLASGDGLAFNFTVYRPGVLSVKTEVFY